MKKILNIIIVTSLSISIISCAKTNEDLYLVNGPPIRNIETHFDNSLKCLKGKIDPSITFSVGTILDSTGKEQITESGTGKFATQGAGDIVQSALLLAGASVVNRRDPRIMTTEIQMGLINNQRVLPSRYFITGSINTLDFITGGGAEVEVAGGGPRLVQNRILVGLDLFVTETSSGKIVASIPLQKQIVANEAGFGLTRFFGSTLVNMDIGGKEREALQFTLRQMLHLATFEMLTQLMNVKNYAECKSEINPEFGLITGTKTADEITKYNTVKEQDNNVTTAIKKNPVASTQEGTDTQKNENSGDTHNGNNETPSNGSNGNASKTSDSYYLDENQKTTLPKAGVLW